MQSAAIQEKSRLTSQIKYGVDYPIQNNIIQARSQDTCLERYGVPFAIRADSVRQKIKNTMDINWLGHPSRNKLVQQRQLLSKQRTCMAKYGGPNEHYATISKESYDILNDSIKFAELLEQNSCYSMAKKLGVGKNIISSRHKKFDLSILKPKGVSSYEQEIAAWLTEQNIHFHKDRKLLGGKELDFYCPQYRVAIEFQGDFWHMNPSIYSENTIHPFKKIAAYEIWANDTWKLIKCRELGIKLLQIWESDWNEYKADIKEMIITSIKQPVAVA